MKVGAKLLITSIFYSLCGAYLRFNQAHNRLQYKINLKDERVSDAFIGHCVQLEEIHEIHHPKSEGKCKESGAYYFLV